jgi:hypothetical protein
MRWRVQLEINSASDVLMFGNFANLANLQTSRVTSHDYLFIISMTKLDTSHILSPKPSPLVSTKIWCFCSYFHLVLLLKQNLVLLFNCSYFHLVPLGQFQFTFAFKIPFRHFVCFGKIINCSAVQLMK